MTTRVPTEKKSRSHGLSPGAGSPGSQPQPDGRVAPATSTVIPILAGHARGVAVVGDLDPATVPLLEAAVAQVCNAPRAGQDPGRRRRFLLDLENVTFLDAGGMFFLARVQEQVDGCGDELLVTAPVPTGPRRVLLLAVTRNLLPAVFSPWSP
jgi:anti-anti-sigma regulatory factor